MSTPKILVVGSANADIFITADVLPRIGETVGGELTKIGPGGKGSNQAAAAHFGSQSLSNVHLITSIGTDQHGDMFLKAYNDIQLDTTIFQSQTTPTGQAYILLQKNSSHNSIIVCPGSNMIFPTELQLDMIPNYESTTPTKCILDSLHEQTKIKTILLSIRAILLQREIPDNVNLFFAYCAQHINLFYNFNTNSCDCCQYHSSSSSSSSSSTSTTLSSSLQQLDSNSKRIHVTLDVGGIGDKVDTKILPYIDILSFNETEMGRVYQQAHQHMTQTIAPTIDITNESLLQLDHIIDSQTGGVYLRDLTFSSNNTQISILNNYNIFSTSNNTTTTDISTTIIDLGNTHLPFDVSSLTHAANAIIAMSRPDHNNNNDIVATKMNPMKLLVTLGQHGSLLLTTNHIINHQLPIKLEPSEIVDSTGCGDAYRGNFMMALVEYLEQTNDNDNNNNNDTKLTQWEYCMRFATAGASFCLGSIGTLPSMGKRSQIEPFLKRVPQ